MASLLDPDEQNLALSQGLLGLGAGMLSGSFGHYGAFAPSFGMGAAGFQHGFNNAVDTSLKFKALAQRKLLNDAEIQNYQAHAKYLGWQEQKARDDQMRMEQASERDRAYPAFGQEPGLQSGVPPAFAPSNIMPGQGMQGNATVPLFAPHAQTSALVGGSGPVGGGVGMGATGADVPTGYRSTVPAMQQVDVRGGLGKANTAAAMAKMEVDYYENRARQEGLPKYLVDSYQRKADKANDRFKEFIKQDEQIAARKAAAHDAKEIAEEGKLRGGKQLYRTMLWNPETQRHDISEGALHEKEAGVTVPIDMRAETAGKVQMAKNDADMIGALQTNDLAANKLKPLLKRMAQNVDNTFSGSTANFATGIGNLATTLGVANPDIIRKVGMSEQATTDVAELVRTKIKALGSGTAISNMDLLFTNRSMPDLLKTPVGRKMVIKAMQADLDLISKDHHAARKYFDDHNGSLSGFVAPSSSAEPIDFKDLDPTSSAKPMLPPGVTYRKLP